MKKLITVVCLLLFVLVLNAQENQTKKYDSIWEGKLKLSSGLSLKIILKIVKNDDGSYSGFLDSPDQGAKDIPASSVAMTEDSLKFESKMIGASYAAKILKDSMITVGKFKQGMANLDLNLKKVDKIAEVRRPQLPVKPYPYNEEEVAFENKEAKITLAGTLTFPKGEGNFPAVVLVTGSGRQDRDEALFEHKPFLVIADYLTRNGIAVLRYDDRGVAKSTGNYSAATTEDFAGDALSAVEYLKSRKEINHKQIGIIGHSEGGMVAPIAATNSNDVAFIVLLAGPGVSGKDVLVRQTGLILKANGMADDEINKNIKQSEEAYEIINNSPDSSTAYVELKKMFDKEVAGLSEEDKKKPEYSEENFNRQMATMLSPWFRFFLKFNPQPILGNVSIPVLALNGEKDLQVDPDQNLSAIEKALKLGGNNNFKTVKLPRLNHLFQTSSTGAPSEYGQIEETFSPDALKIMGDWINEITRSR
jgi:hypothetical protein